MIVALEPDTGKEIWKYDLGQASAPLRGVTNWPGDRQTPAQILAGLSDGRLVALTAKTGQRDLRVVRPYLISLGRC